MKSRIACALVALLVPASALFSYTSATALPKPPAPTAPAVNNTLRALAKLHSFGYSIDTPARADRAIRHWQKANGLVVDGIVGPEVIRSLGIGGATATATAVRVNPPAPQPVVSDDPESIIRAIWPDDIEDWAVRIAKRESNLQPHVRNSCCWGLFQIHWVAHHSWLTAEFGITSPEQLYDPTVNATVALALYMRSTPHCQPWGC
jgi:peptidoglycan hydrolase-like protein with peptidoglycan-binding domain